MLQQTIQFQTTLAAVSGASGGAARRLVVLLCWGLVGINGVQVDILDP